MFIPVIAMFILVIDLSLGSDLLEIPAFCLAFLKLG